MRLNTELRHLPGLSSTSVPTWPEMLSRWNDYNLQGIKRGHH
jgi:hypothetical protein